MCKVSKPESQCIFENINCLDQNVSINNFGTKHLWGRHGVVSKSSPLCDINVGGIINSIDTTNKEEFILTSIVQEKNNLSEVLRCNDLQSFANFSDMSADDSKNSENRALATLNTGNSIEPSVTEDPSIILSELKVKNGERLIIAQININALEHKFKHFMSMIKNRVDIIMASETKVDESFRLSLFTIEWGWHHDIFPRLFALSKG